MADDDLGLPQEAVVLICVLASAFVVCGGMCPCLDRRAESSHAKVMPFIECFNHHYSGTEPGTCTLHLSSNTWRRSGNEIGRNSIPLPFSKNIQQV